MDGKNFNPDKTNDLSYVLAALDGAIEKLGLYRNNRMEGNFWEGASGYFYFSPLYDERLYFIGLWHDGTSEMHNFFIERFFAEKFQVNDKSNGEPCQVNLKYGEFYKKVGSVDWFRLKKEYYDILTNDDKGFDEKFEILKGFIREVRQLDPPYSCEALF